VGEVLVLWQLYWGIFGLEILTISDRGLTREIKVPFYTRTLNYRLNSVARLRWNESKSQQNFNRSFGGSHGSVQFDYGAKTITIAKGVDSGEGHHIIEEIESSIRPYNKE